MDVSEYLSSPFSSSMNSHGIINQTFYPYTSQQSGTTERRNRHLIETARILLIQSHVTLHFWGYSSQILLIVYFSQVSLNQVPYAVLFRYSSCSLFHLMCLEVCVWSITSLREKTSQPIMFLSAHFRLLKCAKCIVTLLT